MSAKLNSYLVIYPVTRGAGPGPRLVPAVGSQQPWAVGPRASQAGSLLPGHSLACLGSITSSTAVKGAVFSWNTQFPTPGSTATPSESDTRQASPLQHPRASTSWVPGSVQGKYRVVLVGIGACCHDRLPRWFHLIVKIKPNFAQAHWCTFSYYLTWKKKKAKLSDRYNAKLVDEWNQIY